MPEQIEPMECTGAMIYAAYSNSAVYDRSTVRGDVSHLMSRRLMNAIGETFSADPAKRDFTVDGYSEHVRQQLKNKLSEFKIDLDKIDREIKFEVLLMYRAGANDADIFEKMQKTANVGIPSMTYNFSDRTFSRAGCIPPEKKRRSFLSIVLER